MALTHTFEGKGSLRLIANGDITIDEIMDVTPVIWSDPRYVAPMRVLCDFRTGRFALSTSEIRTVGEYLSNNRPKNPGRAAVVVADDLSFGLSRMTDLLVSDDVPLEVRPFRDLTEALAWLAEDF